MLLVKFSTFVKLAKLILTTLFRPILSMMDFCNFLASSSGVSCSNLESRRKDYKDFPYTFEHIWILGNKFSAIHKVEDLRTFIRSKIWFSYRSNFSPIGGTGPTTDKHWGCMLRCGQMVMAEALIRCHLGRGWKWDAVAQDPVYLKILSMFQDKKDSPYSIHQIAQMGVSEGKSIGQWFGPNTVAQVLRKLSIYDEWSSIAVHVALDNAVIIEDIRLICKHIVQPLSLRCTNHNLPIVKDPSENLSGGGVLRRKQKWRPMLLFVPLRLGLTTLNPIYIRSLKTIFTMKQCIGMIGGKPSHALWFIGYVGNELVYLDPHTTQPCINLDDEKPDDSSFHIKYGKSKRMSVSDMDPSIALGFYFESEEDFDQWCKTVQNLLVTPEKQPLFELAVKRPDHWPPLELQPDINPSMCTSEFYFVERDRRVDDSDEDFEIFDPIFPSHQHNTMDGQTHSSSGRL